jgi:two-component system, chemotaxis family, CheB/CheR fusion protein
MKNTGGVFLGEDSPGRFAAPGSSYQPLKGFAQSLTIVVADDDKDTVATLAMILRDEGHEVREVTQAGQVLTSVRMFKPDVVILDISMPDASGYEIAKEIRRRFEAKIPLLIAISGVYRKETDKLLSQAVGFHHHLTKPCDPKELLALIAPLAYPS